jgi:periplasmic divalent cation tolerance protein
MQIRFVYMTAGSREEAAAVGRVLVEERLAACVNIISPMQSIYRWQGKIEEDSEVVMIAKTTSRRMDRLISKARELHSYECPCIVAWEIADGNASFLEWIAREVDDQGK